MTAVTPVSSGNGLSLAGRAYEAIRERLVLLDIRPGEPINDDVLARELGTGRTPVREALKQLENDRLVVAFPRRGTFATTVDITDLAHISEIRAVLEPLAAARAARTADAATRRHLGELADEVAQLGAIGTTAAERRALIRRDVELHHAVYRACGNPHLQDILVREDNLATRIWCLFIDRLPDLAGHVGEHAALLRAIADGDADEAARVALEHVTRFDAAVRAVV